MRFENVPEGVLQQLRPIEQVVFRTLEKNTYVQVSSGRLSIHRQPPYTSWEDFGPLVKRVVSTLQDVLGEQKTERLGLRYINLISILGQVVDLDRYFNFRPNLGERLPTRVGRFLLLVEFPFAETRDLCRVQLSTALAEQPESAAFALDLDFFSFKPGSVELSSAANWLEEAHAGIEQTFEGCITDQLRALFSRIE
jgi:uncharacterized protein (TIGR04255 family)